MLQATMTDTKDKGMHDTQNSCNVDIALYHALAFTRMNPQRLTDFTAACNADVCNAWIFASSPMCSGCVVLSQRNNFVFNKPT
jgi:hypothetical protein